MRAEEARALSQKNAEVLNRQRAEEATEKRMKDAAMAEWQRKEFMADFDQSVKDHIRRAVENGEKKAEVALSEDHEDLVAHEYSKNNLWGEREYFENAKYASEIKHAILKLRRDGYKVEIEAEHIKHDTSAAYLNSGGECGSETLWWTCNTVMNISW